MRFCPIAVLLTMALFPGCKTVSYFNTPNELFKTNCVLYLQNGSRQEGKLTIQYERGYDVKNYVEFERNNLNEKIPVADIKCYEVNGSFYYPKILDYELNGSENLLFVKRLSAENSRMHLFELYKRKTENSNTADAYYYFVSFPGRDISRPINVASNKLIPNFDEKMSKLIENCPDLSRKVETKAKGYFLPTYTLGNTKKVEILLRIIEEYNSCR